MDAHLVPNADAANLDARIAAVHIELEAHRSRQTRYARRCILAAVIVPVLLFAPVLAVGHFVSADHAGSSMQVLGGVAVLLSIVIGGSLLYGASVAADERRSATWRIGALESEREHTRAARALAESGEPFALFLRSFGAETQGLSSAARKRGHIASSLAAARSARHGDWYEADIGHIEASNKWRAQLAVLQAIETRLPIILLGNTRLDAEMRSELAIGRIREVTIQAQDWWQIFLGVCGRASMIFLYVEETSPMLLQEMQHIRAHGLTYVLCGSNADIRRLAHIDGLGEAFVAGAVARLGAGDAAAIPGLIDRLQEAG